MITDAEAARIEAWLARLDRLTSRLEATAALMQEASMRSAMVYQATRSRTIVDDIEAEHLAAEVARRRARFDRLYRWLFDRAEESR